MRKVPIRYVGQADMYSDHLYGSGAVWPMQESVVDVDIDKAIKFLDHTEFEDARDDTSVPLKDLLTEPQTAAAVEEDLTNEAPLVNLETLTKAQLLTYAQRNFGLELPPDSKKADIINTVRLNMRKALV